MSELQEGRKAGGGEAKKEVAGGGAEDQRRGGGEQQTPPTREQIPGAPLPWRQLRVRKTHRNCLKIFFYLHLLSNFFAKSKPFAKLLQMLQLSKVGWIHENLGV